MSHIPIITRNDTIDEWRIQTNLTANAMNRLETGQFEKTGGDLILSGASRLIITSNANPSLTVSSNVSVSNNMTVGGSITASSVTVSGNTKSVSYQETKATLSGNNIDLSTGNYFTKTITATTNFTVSNVAPSGTVSSFILDITNGGSQTVNWWTGLQWPNGTTPTLTTSGRDVLGFFTHNGGSTWSGFVLGKNFS